MNLPEDFFFQLLLFLAGAFIGILGAIIKDVWKKILASLLAIALIATSAILWFVGQNSSFTCPYNGSTDNETFTNLILGEENAALNENFSILDKIYLPGATVTDGTTGITSPVSQHYQQLFSTLKFLK